MINGKIKGKSQYNEDEIIEVIFKVLRISKGIFFEVGVNDMSEDRSLQCNSINLLNNGWEGILIDSSFEHPLVLNEFVSLENINNLAKIAGDKINFFSIDIDSYDWHIVREVLRQKIVDVDVFCVETNNYNGHCFLDRVLKLDAPAPNTNELPKNDAFGATTFSYNLLMVKYGYRLIATSQYGVNAFFIKEKYANLFPKSGKIKDLYKHSNNLITNWSEKGPKEHMTMAKKLLDK